MFQVVSSTCFLGQVFHKSAVKIVPCFSEKEKPYNLTYFIKFIVIAAFRSHKYVTKYTKPYKMCYIEDFIRLFGKLNFIP